MNKKNTKDKYDYDLYAVIIHQGNAHGGHYYPYILDDDSSTWFRYNDRSIKPVSFDTVMNDAKGGNPKTMKSAYMLFYKDASKKAIKYNVKVPQSVMTHVKNENEKFVDKITNFKKYMKDQRSMLDNLEKLYTS